MRDLAGMLQQYRELSSELDCSLTDLYRLMIIEIGLIANVKFQQYISNVKNGKKTNVY